MRQIKSRIRTRNPKRKRSNSDDENLPSKRRRINSKNSFSSETRKALKSLLKPKISQQSLRSPSLSDQLMKFSAKTSGEYKIAVPSFIGKRQANLRGRRLNVDEQLLVLQEDEFHLHASNKEELNFLKNTEPPLQQREDDVRSKKISSTVSLRPRKTRSSQKDTESTSPPRLNQKKKDGQHDSNVIKTPSFRVREYQQSTSEENSLPNQFVQPPSYIRFQHKTEEEIYQQDEYDLDDNDEQWIKNNWNKLNQTLKQQSPKDTIGESNTQNTENENSKSKSVGSKSRNRLRTRTRKRTHKRSFNSNNSSNLGRNSSEIFDKFEQVMDKLEKEYHPNLIDDTKDTIELIESEGILDSSSDSRAEHCLENVIEYFAWLGEEEEDGSSVPKPFISCVYEYWLKKKESSGMLPLIQRMRQFKMYLVRTKRRGTTQRKSHNQRIDISTMRYEELVQEYEKFEELRQQLEMVRLLSDIVKRREKLKKAHGKVSMDILNQAFERQ